MTRLEKLCKDYERVEQAIRFLESNAASRPSLSQVAAHVGLSEFHFQRLFSRWVGISPKRFLQFLTHAHARKMIACSDSLLAAAYEAGLSGPGRLHDLFVSCEAVTPGQVKQRGEGLCIDWGVHPTPFGRCLIAASERGIVSLHFLGPRTEQTALAEIEKRWPEAEIRKKPHVTAGLANAVFPFSGREEPAPVYLHVRGTNFQIRVWEALLKIPLGKAVTYEDIARHIGMPKAARAVGNAVGANPIPFLIPCHRVIRKTGVFGNYGAGPARKKAMLGWESARVAAGA
ncbi:MAG: methylated-DNA--[protein]-cysteine S-methyltransferase [Desulfobacterales bacterium]|jgi:AraC family transcriptional regulator of adaptative response/methylated-DNA-[protein]-cysteine methyltransferase